MASTDTSLTNISSPIPIISNFTSSSTSSIVSSSVLSSSSLTTSITFQLLGLGYPLVDIIQRLPDQSLLEKYKLKENDAILAQSEHLLLYQELLKLYHNQYQSNTSIISDNQVYITAGGSTLNTIRIAAWIINAIEKNHAKVGFIGRIGTDEYSDLLEQAMELDHVYSLCEKSTISPSNSNPIDDLPTGTSAVLVYKDNRSLITYLGISRHLSLAYIQSSRMQQYIQSCPYMYSCGFMCQYAAPEHFDCVSYISELTLTSHHKFAINLSAEYICRDYTTRLLQLIHRATYVFGNEAEALVLGTTKQWIPTNTSDDNNTDNQLIYIAQQLSTYTDTNELNLLHYPTIILPTRRHVIITRGSKPALLVTSQGTIHHIPIVDKYVGKVVDPTGAGDAFVGGFFGTLILNDKYQWYNNNKDDLLIKAIQVGHWAASKIIGEIGVQFNQSIICPLLQELQRNTQQE